MANANTAVQFVLDNEGILENNFYDSGGLTKFGISQKFLQLSTVQAKYPGLSVKDLTLEQATQIYLEFFWSKVNGDQIENQIVANKILDLSVNLPNGSGVRLVQRALGVPQDGVLGSHTLDCLNSADPVKLLLEIRARQCEFYARTVLKNPSDVIFLLGWMRRAVKP